LRISDYRDRAESVLYDALRNYSHFRNRISWETRLGWAIQLTTALNALHNSGFVHGNLSLRTIFLVPPTGDHELGQSGSRYQGPDEGCPLISSAHRSIPHPRRASFPVIADPLSGHTILVSTPELSPIPRLAAPYIAPELILVRRARFSLRARVNAPSDVYALGAILWALGANEPHLPVELPFSPDQRGRKSHFTQAELRYWEVVGTCREVVQERRIRTDMLLQSLREISLANDESIQPT